MSRRPDPPAPTIADAVDEAEEAARWQCRSCDRPISPDDEYAPYCLHCGSYWQEVENGLFDRFYN